MNSEMTNVSKLVPVPILRNKQNDLNISSDNAIASQEPKNTAVSVSKDGLKIQAALKPDEKKPLATEVSFDLLKSAAEKGNSILQATNRNLEFQVDDSTKKVVVKIVDSKSGDVVRQIPSEEVLAFIERMQELEGNQGSMLQDKA
ncbi:MAG: flagellar protein FlaG [Methylobacter sp.]|uniref:Flagellar protein FlaG n=1 Tax=Candidatus Methylobacter titanis TaxID=3053457 RepID=A0AA43Q893_9GAMM|nr:flagellar protein FlaG [Candidatus Methylobacter titanis]